MYRPISTVCVALSLALTGCSVPSTDTTGTAKAGVTTPATEAPAMPAAPQPAPELEAQVVEFDSPVPQAVSVTEVTTRYGADSNGEPVWVVSAVLTNRSRVSLPGVDVLALVSSGDGESAVRASRASRAIFETPVVQDQSVPWQIQVAAVPRSALSSDDTPVGHATVTVERWLDAETLAAKWKPMDVRNSTSRASKAPAFRVP